MIWRYDLPLNVHGANMVMFADDINILITDIHSFIHSFISLFSMYPYICKTMDVETVILNEWMNECTPPRCLNMEVLLQWWELLMLHILYHQVSLWMLCSWWHTKRRVLCSTQKPHQHPSSLATPFPVLMPLPHCHQTSNYKVVQIWPGLICV